MCHTSRTLLNYILSREHLFYEIKIFHLQAIANLQTAAQADTLHLQIQFNDITHLLHHEEKFKSQHISQMLHSISIESIPQLLNDASQIIDLLYRRFRAYFPKNAQNFINEHQRLINQITSLQPDTTGVKQLMDLIKIRLQTEVNRISNQLTTTQLYMNQKFIEKDTRNLRYFNVARTVDTFRYIQQIYKHYLITQQPRDGPSNYLDVIEDLDVKTSSLLQNIPCQSIEMLLDASNETKLVNSIDCILNSQDSRLRELRQRNFFVKGTITQYCSSSYVQRFAGKESFSPPKAATTAIHRELPVFRSFIFHQPRNGSLKDLLPVKKAPTIKVSVHKQAPLYLNTLAMDQSQLKSLSTVKSPDRERSIAHNHRIMTKPIKLKPMQPYNEVPQQSEQERTQTPHIKSPRNVQSYLFQDIAIPQQKRMHPAQRFKSLETEPMILTKESSGTDTLKNQQNAHLKAFFKQYFNPISKSSLSHQIEFQYRRLESKGVKRSQKQMTVKDTIMSYHSSQMCLY